MPKSRPRSRRRGDAAPPGNDEIAAALEQVADLLELTGANPFRARAYRAASRTAETASESLAALHASGGTEALEALKGIGADLAAKIAELIETGGMEQLDALDDAVPDGVLAFTRIPGLGPKRAGRLWRELDLETLDALEAAAKDGRVQELSGFGPGLVKKIVAGIGQVRSFGERVRLDEADEAAARILDALAGASGVERMDAAGSLRRRRETVGDVDILAVSADGEDVSDRLAAHDDVEEVLARGPTKTSVRLRGGLQVDLRVVPPECAGSALHHFTGSKEHNVALRALAQKAGLKMSEWGVFDGEERVAGRTEEQVFEALGLPFIPPELRHGSGEIDAAREGHLPELVALDDIKGDLQMHTTDSDGRHSLEEMVAACRERGYAYMAVTDHSPSVRVANGLSAARFRRQYAAIEALREREPGIAILRSAEVDILADGSLDLPDDVLAEMDVVLVSVHSKFDMTEAEMTARIATALRHPRVKILGHPTGRLVNRRPPYPLDVAEIIRVAAGEGVLLECNAHPARLDLRDTHLAAARDAGVPIVVSTDAHSSGELGLMRYGVDQARRAGLEARDVANARPLEEFLALIGA